MIPLRNTPKGPMRLQGYAHFTNKLMAWRDNHNEHNPNVFIHVWHHRDKKGPVGDKDVAQSSEQAEEDDEQEEELVLPTPSMAFDDAAGDPIIYPQPSSSRMPALMRPEQTREDNHLGVPTFLGANIPEQTANTAPPESIYSPVYPSNFLHQNIYSAADYTQDNHLGIPTFLGTNQFSQMTNTVPSDSIYTAIYSPAFPSSNLYSSAGNPCDFAPGDSHPLLNTPNAGTYLRAQNTNTVESDSIYSAGYAPALASSNIYTAANYPFHLAHTDGYSSAYNYNNPAATAPDVGNIPGLTNYTAMAPWSESMQPDYTCRQSVDEVRQGDFGLHRPEFPAHHEPHPPISVSSSAQPITTAISAPVLPSENANTTFSSPEADPFMGADWSPEMSEDWL